MTESFESELAGLEQDFQQVFNEFGTHFQATLSLSDVVEIVRRKAGSPFSALSVLTAAGVVENVTVDDVVSALGVFEKDEKTYVGAEGGDAVMIVVDALARGIVIGVTPELKQWFSDHGRPLRDDVRSVTVAPITFKEE